MVADHVLADEALVRGRVRVRVGVGAGARAEVRVGGWLGLVRVGVG